MIARVEITVNGDPQALSSDLALTTLLRVRGIEPDEARGVAVAINDAVVRRQAWAEVQLAAGDRVEIVTARQGG